MSCSAIELTQCQSYTYVIIYFSVLYGEALVVWAWWNVKYWGELALSSLYVQKDQISKQLLYISTMGLLQAMSTDQDSWSGNEYRWDSWSVLIAWRRPMIEIYSNCFDIWSFWTYNKLKANSLQYFTFLCFCNFFAEFNSYSAQARALLPLAQC